MTPCPLVAHSSGFGGWIRSRLLPVPNSTDCPQSQSSAGGVSSDGVVIAAVLIIPSVEKTYLHSWMCWMILIREILSSLLYTSIKQISFCLDQLLSLAFKEFSGGTRDGRRRLLKKLSYLQNISVRASTWSTVIAPDKTGRKDPCFEFCSAVL